MNDAYLTWRLGIGSIARAPAFLAMAMLFVIAPAGCGEKAKPTVVESKPAAEVYVPPGNLEPNIVRVNKIFESFPWLSYSSDGSGRVDGFKCAVYLESPTSRSKGVFGRGTIVVNMFRLEKDATGREMAVPVQEWQLPPETAYSFQSKNPTALGWGYGLRLRWDDNVSVAGSVVAIVIKFIREDGRVVSSSRKVLRVPVTGNAPPTNYRRSGNNPPVQ